jgi:hypothetical protein
MEDVIVDNEQMRDLKFFFNLREFPGKCEITKM